MAEMVLIFNEDGSVYKETRGFKGKSCVDKTKFIEDALGVASDRKLKAEYHEQESQKEKISN
jgi:hypothetical protein